jgi:hypothetical protein
VRVILGRASAAPAKKKERRDGLIFVVVVVVVVGEWSGPRCWERSLFWAVSACSNTPPKRRACRPRAKPREPRAEPRAGLCTQNQAHPLPPPLLADSTLSRQSAGAVGSPQTAIRTSPTFVPPHTTPSDALKIASRTTTPRTSCTPTSSKRHHISHLSHRSRGH